MTGVLCAFCGTALVDLGAHGIGCPACAAVEELGLEQYALIAKASALGVQIHRCGCEACARTNVLCPATMSSLHEDVRREEDRRAARRSST